MKTLLNNAVAVLVFFSVLHSAPCAWAHDNWKAIGNGISLNRVLVHPSGFLSPEILLIKVDLKQYRIATVRGIDFGSRNRDVRSLSKASKALVGINANFFDEKGRPLGLVMSNGIVQQKMHNGGKTLTGIFQISRQGASIVPRPSFNFETVTEAIQAGPRLIDASKPVSGQRDSHTRSRRAGICVRSPEEIILYISSGIIGASISEVQSVLQQPGVSCTQALNLDGGGSAQLFVSSHLPEAIEGLREITIHGRDDIPVILGIFPRR